VKKKTPGSPAKVSATTSPVPPSKEMPSTSTALPSARSPSPPSMIVVTEGSSTANGVGNVTVGTLPKGPLTSTSPGPASWTAAGWQAAHASATRAPAAATRRRVLGSTPPL